jgi:hypothetical protein
MLLEELEDEINRWQKDFAPTASTSSVHDVRMVSGAPKKEGDESGTKGLSFRFRVLLFWSRVLNVK